MLIVAAYERKQVRRRRYDMRGAVCAEFRLAPVAEQLPEAAYQMEAGGAVLRRTSDGEILYHRPVRKESLDALARILPECGAPYDLFSMGVGQTREDLYEKVGEWLLRTTGTDLFFRTRRPVFDFPLLKRMVRYGLPAGLHLAIDLFSFNTFSLLLGSSPNIRATGQHCMPSSSNSTGCPPITGRASALTSSRYKSFIPTGIISQKKRETILCA